MVVTGQGAADVLLKEEASGTFILPIDTPIPNVFFKPLRRKQDEEIYKQTADEIRSILAPSPWPC